jgi:hypothetical protein
VARDAIQDLLAHQHALRTAEAAERGVRGQVRLRDQPGDGDGGAVVRVVHVHHGAHQHRRRQVAAPAAVGGERDPHRVQLALGVEADLVATEERVALAGQLHVESALELDAHRTLRDPGGERGQRRNRIGLRLLAAEAAAHAETAAHHAVRRNARARARR